LTSAEQSKGQLTSQRQGPQLVSWALVLALTVALILSTAGSLWAAWHEDATLSHGPILLLIVAVLLWLKKSSLRTWESAEPPGLIVLGFSAVIQVASVWIDIAFLKPLSLLMVIGGGILFLGGKEKFNICIGPIGLLAWAIPWPTTLVSALSFPLQLLSSAYSALFAGAFGLNIHREGVHVSVISESGDKAIYSMLVAQQCSGLTSLMVLLAFGYLIAYFTPVRWWGRLLILAIVVPLAIFANAVRLTIILLVGGLYSAKLAGWVHDNEQPFLIFICSFGLLSLRNILMRWIPIVENADNTIKIEKNEDMNNNLESDINYDEDAL
jgi:exosortase